MGGNKHTAADEAATCAASTNGFEFAVSSGTLMEGETRLAWRSERAVTKTPSSILPPPWLLALGSLAVAGHLFILGISSMMGSINYITTMYGGDLATPPVFAVMIDDATRPGYLRMLKMTSTYHFMTNRAEIPDAYLEVRLRNEAGELAQTLKLPEEGVNAWVRHRQELLARYIMDDRPLPPPAGEVLPAPGQPLPTVQFWRPGPDRISRLHSEAQHLVPRNAPLFQPSELSLILARSYARHLCRKHGAASAEIIRHSRQPLSPVVLFQPEVPPDATEELVASFGEMPK